MALWSHSLEKSEVDANLNNIPYRQLIGSLQYLVAATRPDIANAVRNLSKFLSCYEDSHWKQAKRVMRYLQGTKSLFMRIDTTKMEVFQLLAYCDADFANEKDDRKSISGYAIMFGPCCISYRSRNQSIVTMSTAEAEYIALADCVKEVLWYFEMLEELGFRQDTIVMHCDNQSAIAIAKSPDQYDRMKHISIKYHFVRDCVEKGWVTLEYCPTKNQVADILTKAIPKEQFKALRSKLGILGSSN